jgi:type IV secretion system protein VirD4
VACLLATCPGMKFDAVGSTGDEGGNMSSSERPELEGIDWSGRFKTLWSLQYPKTKLLLIAGVAFGAWSGVQGDWNYFLVLPVCLYALFFVKEHSEGLSNYVEEWRKGKTPTPERPRTNIDHLKEFANSWFVGAVLLTLLVYHTSYLFDPGEPDPLKSIGIGTALGFVAVAHDKIRFIAPFRIVESILDFILVLPLRNGLILSAVVTPLYALTKGTPLVSLVHFPWPDELVRVFLRTVLVWWPIDIVLHAIDRFLLPALSGSRLFGRGLPNVSDVINFSVSLANRGHTFVVGLWYVVGGLLLIVIAQDVFTTNDLAWVRYAAIAYGVYLVVARGLGPIWNALSWSKLKAESHGRARMATANELRQAGLIPRKPDAVYLGKFLDNGREGERVGYPGGSPLITIGRTGSGKGMGLIVPNLSVLRRSILIIDPKGEAAAMTARKRAKFGRVVILNPFNYLAHECPWLRSDGYNPLASIHSNKNFVSDCTVVGHSLVKQEKDGNGKFFSTSAHDLVTALIMYEVIEKERTGEWPSLANVWSMLTEPWGGNAETGPTGIAKTIFEMAYHENPSLRSLAGRFAGVSKSNRDIISTAINELSFINDPEMGNNLSDASGFRFGDMKKEIVSVYLILDAKHMESHSNWLRVVIASALSELTSTPPAKGMPPVLFMLDEFANLGHLPAISSAMNMTRGYGVQLWPFVQDLTQLKDLYGDRWENFLGARSALTAFAPNEAFTADYLSRLCGNKTIIVESENERSGSAASGRGRAPQGVPLIRPEEIRAMPQEQMLCFIDPVKQPFMATAPGYWKTDFKEGLDENPYHPN